MRWVVLLFVFIIACGPAAQPTPTIGPASSLVERVRAARAVTPTPTPTPMPTMALLTKESCITLLQPYYTAEEWDDLQVFDFVRLIHVGEWVCEDQAGYSTAPLQVRLLMWRIFAMQSMLKIQDDAGDGHCHNPWGEISYIC